MKTIRSELVVKNKWENIEVGWYVGISDRDSIHKYLYKKSNPSTIRKATENGRHAYLPHVEMFVPGDKINYSGKAEKCEVLYQVSDGQHRQQSILTTLTVPD